MQVDKIIRKINVYIIEVRRKVWEENIKDFFIKIN